MSEKPVIFISHSSEDKKYALEFKTTLEQGFREDYEMEVEVFVSSAPKAITIGRDWQNDVIEKLDKSTALIVVLTPRSVEKPWVWFEVGYFWKKRKDNQKLHIYPLYEPEMKIPSPLNVLQGKMLGNEEELQAFFEQLIIQITEDAENERIDGADSQQSSLSSTENYSDQALIEILTEYIEQQRFRYGHSLRLRDMMGNFEPNLFTGALIDFNLLDKDLKISAGTSKRLLKSVAARQGLIPKVDTENNIRFEYKSELDTTIEQLRG